MKRYILLITTVFIALFSQGQDEKGNFVIPVKNWNMQIAGLENFYPTYLADPLGVRFEVSAQTTLYSDLEFDDPVNSDGSYTGKLVIYPGVRISLFKFSPKSNPNLGVEVDLGLVTPAFMRGGNHDMIGYDGIYYFAIAGRPTEWLSLRFSKHHICTHIGDEYNSGTVHSVIDYDPNTTQFPVRDDFIVSAAVRPLWFLKNPDLDMLLLYGDFGFFVPGSDFMGGRQNKPHADAWFNVQGGAEVEYYFPWKYVGGMYGAINVSAYQLNAWSPNLSVTAGYLFPQTLGGRRLRIGINYYNGRSLINQFYNRKEKFIAFQVALDV